MTPFSVLLDQLDDDDLDQWLAIATLQGKDALVQLGKRYARMDQDAAPDDEIHRAIHHLRDLIYEDFNLAFAFHDALMGPDSPWGAHSKTRAYAHEQIWSRLGYFNLSAEDIEKAVAHFGLTDTEIPMEQWGYSAQSMGSMFHWMQIHRPKLLKDFISSTHNIHTVLCSAALSGEDVLDAVLSMHPDGFENANFHAKRHLLMRSLLSSSLDDCSTDARELMQSRIVARLPTGYSLEVAKLEEEHMRALSDHASEALLQDLFEGLKAPGISADWVALGEVSLATFDKWEKMGAPLLSFRNERGDSLAHILAASENHYSAKEVLKWLALKDPSLAVLPNNQGVRPVDLLRDSRHNYIADALEKLHVAWGATNLDMSTPCAPSKTSRPRI